MNLDFGPYPAFVAPPKPYDWRDEFEGPSLYDFWKRTQNYLDYVWITRDEYDCLADAFTWRFKPALIYGKRIIIVDTFDTTAYIATRG